MALRLSPHMTVMQNAAQKAAKRLLRDFNEVEQLQVSVKGPSDFVSQADLRAEQTVREELTKARPGYSFLMEESGKSGSDNWTWRWVVDPLDGTTNFLHGVPHWCISIALERRLDNNDTEIAAGMIYNPVHDEMFWAERGAGAFLNEKRLRVSARRELKDALFATGIPFAAVSAPNRLAFARTLGTLMPQVAGIRRFGAAALDMAWVAAGRYDGYWELGLKPWDMAAGLLIVREAGGFVTDAAGRESVMQEGPNDVVTANPHMHKTLLGLVAEGVHAAEGRARLMRPALLVLAASLAASPLAAQVTVNPGALELLPTQPTPRQPRQAVPPRPIIRHTTPSTAPMPPAAPPPPLVAKPTLPVTPPAIAALPPPLPVPAPRPQPAPVVPVAADAPGAATTSPNGLRITFGPDRQDLNPTTEAALRDLARSLRANQVAINVYAYAAGTAEDPSTARRLSLGRALAARAVLITEGIASTRIYPRALGATGGDTDPDRVDLTTGPPGPPAPPK